MVFGLGLSSVLTTTPVTATAAVLSAHDEAVRPAALEASPLYVSKTCSAVVTTSTSFQTRPGRTAEYVVDYLFTLGQPSDTLTEASIKQVLIGISITVCTGQIVSASFNKAMNNSSSITSNLQHRAQDGHQLHRLEFWETSYGHVTLGEITISGAFSIFFADVLGHFFGELQSISAHYEAELIIKTYLSTKHGFTLQASLGPE